MLPGKVCFIIKSRYVCKDAYHVRLYIPTVYATYVDVDTCNILRIHMHSSYLVGVNE